MDEAEKGIANGNLPFGAVLADIKGKVIATAHNTTKSECDPTAHAEINLLRKACKKLQTTNLENYCMISNAESCPMCMSASIKAKIASFYFGAPSEKNMDPNLTVFDVAKKSKCKLNIETGILKDECITQIKRGRNA